MTAFSIGARVTSEAPEDFLNLSNRNAHDLLAWLEGQEAVERVIDKAKDQREDHTRYN